MIYVWITVGCLECGNMTVVRGVYATLDEVQAAVAGDDYDDSVVVLEVGQELDDESWCGEGINVIAVCPLPA